MYKIVKQVSAYKVRLPNGKGYNNVYADNLRALKLVISNWDYGN